MGKVYNKEQVRLVSSNIMDREHEDYRLLLYAKNMSYSTFNYKGKDYQYITIRDALKWIGAV